MPKMTEPSEESKYIKCSTCWCKYINDDEHVKQDFGYSKLEERFKTCVKCRGRSSKYKKVYQENRRGQFDPQIFEHHQFCTRCFTIKP